MTSELTFILKGFECIYSECIYSAAGVQHWFTGLDGLIGERNVDFDRVWCLFFSWVRRSHVDQTEEGT